MGRYQNQKREGGLHAGKRAAFFKPGTFLPRFDTRNLKINLAN